MSGFWKGRRVCVTGGGGFLGRAVVAALARAGCEDPFIVRSAEYDLRLRDQADRMVADARPDLLIHLAARVGGIGANRRQPGTFFHDNMAMGLHVIEAARRHRVGKLVVLGTICSYPKHAEVPFREADLWLGYPEETNAAYGVAKKALLVMLQAYRQEFGLNGIFLMPVNLYGPHDNFDPQASHVIPALIRKCVEARRSGAPSVDCWGTGSATREFLFVDDCAEAIVLASERYDGAEPMNLGSGREIPIRDLAVLIARSCGFTGALIWDPSQPDGQPRRRLDTSRAREAIGWVASTSLEEGLSKTIGWYEKAGPAVAG